MRYDRPPTTDQPTADQDDSSYPANPNAWITIPFIYNYKNNWIEAGQDAVDQILDYLGFRNADEYNACFSIYGFNLLFKDSFGYLFREIKDDTAHLKPSKYFSGTDYSVKRTVFSNFLQTSAATAGKSFDLSNPTDFYLYLFGAVTSNESEENRFNHIRNWFINKAGIYSYTETDHKFHDENVDLKNIYFMNKYLTEWKPARNPKLKFIPPANKNSENRSILLSAHVVYLIKSFLKAYRNPVSSQNVAEFYQKDQGIISGLLGIVDYVESAVLNSVTKVSRSFGEFLYTGPAGKSSWKLSTYIDIGFEVPIGTLAKAIDFSAGIWQAKWCVYNESTNEGYIFNASCFTVSASIGVSSNFGQKYLKYLHKNDSKAITDLINKLSPRGKKFLEGVLSNNLTLGRADLLFNGDIYEVSGPISRQSFSGNLETGNVSLSLPTMGAASQSVLISEDIPLAKPRYWTNPKTGGNLPLPPQTADMRMKAVILMEGLNNNNSLGASFSIQRGFGTCSIGDKVDYKKFLSWFNS